MAPTLLFILLVQFCTTITTTCHGGATPPDFPAILIFGDSLLDTGNNNYIPTVARANDLQYGQDFPGKIPTGRFSNGKLMSDLLASELGIKETAPPFLAPNLMDSELRTGVCFASAGSGYDDITNSEAGVIPVSEQPEYFKRYVKRLVGVVGNKEAKKIVNGSLVVVTSGSNDMAFNFYNGPIRSSQYNLGGYQDFLQQKIQKFVKKLYNLGLRNFLIAGLPPLGCGPAQMSTKYTVDMTCLEDQNLDSQAYNEKLVALLPQIQESLPGSKIVYADIYTPLHDMATNPKKYGFVVTNRGCCGIGLYEAGPLCGPMTPTCANRSQYLFWDAVHPTESAYRYMTKHIQDQALPQFSQI